MRQAKEVLGLLFISNSLYRVMLSFYPSKFRLEFGLDMARTFSDCSRDAYLEQGGAGLLWVWISHLFDLIKTVFEQHILESNMNKSTQQTTVVGGILVGIGLVFLTSQFSNFSILTWAIFMATVGVLTTVQYLRDRSHSWLMVTSYVFWVLAGVFSLIYFGESPDGGIIKIDPIKVDLEELIGPFVLLAIAIPFWVSYFNNKKRGYLVTAYTLSVLILGLVTALFFSGDFIPSLVMFGIALPMLYSYFKEQNHARLVPAYLLTAVASSFTVGMTLDQLFDSDNIFIYGLGGGILLSGLGLLALRPLVKKTNPSATLQTVVIGGIMAVFGGLMIFGATTELSTSSAFYALGSIGVVTGVWYLADRSQTWLGRTSYVMFVLVGVAYIAVGSGDAGQNAGNGQYVAPLVLGSIAVPFLLTYFRNKSKQGVLVAGYVLSAMVGLLLLVFGNLPGGNFMAPYIMFAVGLPFLFAFFQNQTRWALIPGYAILSLAVALLVGILVEDTLSFEGAFQYTVASLLVLAGLGMQVLRPMLKEQIEVA